MSLQDTNKYEKINVSRIKNKNIDLGWLGSRKNTIPCMQTAFHGLHLRGFMDFRLTMGILRGSRQGTQSH